MRAFDDADVIHVEDRVVRAPQHGTTMDLAAMADSRALRLAVFRTRLRTLRLSPTSCG
jgi:hypothetical protein